jgi:hypothetical protein
MSECKLDHSLAEVQVKLEDQRPYLPEALFLSITDVLLEPQSQDRLNELFHLLKKYDLATEEEQIARNEKLSAFVQA